MTQANPKDNPVDTEQPDDNAPQATPESATEGGNDRIAALEAQLAEANDKMLRAMAETENLRRRAERERQDTAKFAVTSFARDILNVSDNLRRALDAITEDQRKASPEFANIYTGVEATERELLRIFENNGIKKLEPLDVPFDPNKHEVMFEGDAPNKAPGTIIQLIAPGYVIHDRLLRPARVGVAKGGMESGGKVDEEV